MQQVKLPRIDTTNYAGDKIGGGKYIHTLKDGSGGTYPVNMLPIGSPRSITQEEKEARVIADYQDGDPSLDICARHDIGTGTLYKILDKNNIQRRYAKRQDDKII